MVGDLHLATCHQHSLSYYSALSHKAQACTIQVAGLCFVAIFSLKSRRLCTSTYLR